MHKALTLIIPFVIFFGCVNSSSQSHSDGVTERTDTIMISITVENAIVVDSQTVEYCNLKQHLRRTFISKKTFKEGIIILDVGKGIKKSYMNCLVESQLRNFIDTIIVPVNGKKLRWHLNESSDSILTINLVLVDKDTVQINGQNHGAESMLMIMDKTLHELGNDSVVGISVLKARGLSYQEYFDYDNKIQSYIARRDSIDFKWKESFCGDCF